MKKLIAAAAFVTAFAGMTAANAMPLAPSTPSNTDVIKVAGGCGPGFHRGPYGGCVPNRGPIVRRCPPGFRIGPYGRCYRRW
ncbi:MAG: hypothetical protein K2W78_09370 [Xanthobacteraceae bacterium]|nr:hypothetical protein [Xanthobacteraceae bacterium]